MQIINEFNLQELFEKGLDTFLEERLGEQWDEIHEPMNPEKQEEPNDHEWYKPVEKTTEVVGHCILKIQIRNYYEYERWKKYNGGRQWEFMHNYPAIMQAEYNFKTVLDIEMMVKKIVQLMMIGFKVYSCEWRLEDKEKSNSQKIQLL